MHLADYIKKKKKQPCVMQQDFAHDASVLSPIFNRATSGFFPPGRGVLQALIASITFIPAYKWMYPAVVQEKARGLHFSRHLRCVRPSPRDAIACTFLDLCLTWLEICRFLSMTAFPPSCTLHDDLLGSQVLFNGRVCSTWGGGADEAASIGGAWWRVRVQVWQARSN